MSEPLNPAWIDERLKDRLKGRKAKQISELRPGVKIIDASKFPSAISELAQTIINKLEREGCTVMGLPDNGFEISLILRQVAHTYALIRFINADETRLENYGYRSAYSFVSLPLVRTMIDGLYNCTAMLNDPLNARRYKISGFFRMRETLQANETAYADKPEWTEALKSQRHSFEEGLRINGISTSELDNKKNKWPLLGDYLQGADTLHKQFLRKLTLGFWREYSSISHASLDGLTSIFPFIMDRDLPVRARENLNDATERTLAMHVFRAGGLLMCLVTEIQHLCQFEGANIDLRLTDTWASMLEIYEIRELYELRYHALLIKPIL